MRRLVAVHRWEVYEFYSETKVGYCDFSGALQRPQIDNYAGTPG